MGRIYKRAKCYYADYMARARRKRKSLGNISRKDAERILRKLEGDASMASVGILTNDCSVTELRRSYLTFARQTLRPKSFVSAESCLNNILSHLSVQRVSEVTTDKVVNYREWRLSQTVKDRKRKISPRTVNMEVGALSAMLNYGVQQGMIGTNPIRGFKRLRNDRPYKERRPLTEAEVQAILAASTDHYRPIWRAFLTTGMREGELAKLRFKDVDWETREFIVRSHTAKNHTERRIPIEDELVWQDLLHRRATVHLRQPGKGTTRELTERIGHRFTRENVYVSEANTPLGNNIQKRFYATCRRAGVDVSGLEEGQGNSVDIHALRGTFATHAASNGGDIAALGEVTGHKDISILLKHYTKAMAQTKRRAVASLPWSSVTTKAPDGTVAIDRHRSGTVKKKASQAAVVSRVG